MNPSTGSLRECKTLFDAYICVRLNKVLQLNTEQLASSFAEAHESLYKAHEAKF